MTLTFRIVGPEDASLLADMFREIYDTFLRPHPFDVATAYRLAHHLGPDVYALLMQDGRPVAYGMLRGWDEGYRIPTLGIAVRTSLHGRGLGRIMMERLHQLARDRACPLIRLKVHPDNVRARHLYESMGYVSVGVERGELVMVLDLRDPDGTAKAAAGRRVMEGRIIEPEDPAWADVLARARHDFYHVPGYVRLAARQEGGRPAGVLVTDGASALLLPIIVRDIVPGGGKDVTSPYGYPGPLVTDADPGFLLLALATAREVLHGAGIVSAFIRLHPILNPVIPPTLGLLVNHGRTVAIDVARSDAELWADLRSNHRRDITRAREAGWQVRVDTGWEHLAAFRRLYRETMQRRNAEAYYLFEDAYFDQLREVLGDALALLVVERDGVVASAGLFTVIGDIAEYHLSGTDAHLGSLQPLKLMLHEAGAWARSRGATVLHLGGGVGSADDSLLHYKLGFSPHTYRFSTLRMVLDIPAYRRLVRKRDPGLDPSGVNSFFPLYRIREVPAIVEPDRDLAPSA